jgi:hypothetical protein
LDGCWTMPVARLSLALDPQGKGNRKSYNVVDKQGEVAKGGHEFASDLQVGKMDLIRPLSFPLIHWRM